ncbi:MAG TPA: M23 family metallopeptidase [Stellaceae bacterium]|nr:M23 family metallopeptidase [Stellaceae bacterium]
MSETVRTGQPDYDPDDVTRDRGGCPAEPVAIRTRRFFPERRIEIHGRVRTLAVTLSRRLQFGALSALVAAAAAAGYIGVNDLAYQTQLDARQAETVRTAAANSELRDYAARLQQKLARRARDLAEAQNRVAARRAEAEALRARLAAAEQRLRQLEAASAQAAAAALQHAPVPAQQAAEIAALQRALAEAQRQQQDAAAQHAAIAGRLAEAEADLARAAGRTAMFKTALAEMTARFDGQPASTPAVLRTAAAPGILGKVERTLAAAGINAERIFASFGIRRDVGGPFIPARAVPAPAQMAAQQAAVRAMLKTLPVDEPLSHFRETSPFGARRDPINHRGGFHPGVDLAVPYGTPVYATAPGIVAYAGWMDGYGKLVEINHGHGIATRYGHLHRYTVVVGEKVAAGTQIGYVGTTGRSTGPHLHYEVRLNGEPVNPAAFLALGRQIAPAAGGAVIPVAAR